jgi:hypothetical protein
VNEGPLETIERLLAEEEDADDVLRGAVSALASEPGIAWAGIGFAEGNEIALGPSAGAPDPARRSRITIRFQEDVVGELWVDGDADAELLERIARRIAPQVLIGWDTGGEAWEP